VVNVSPPPRRLVAGALAGGVVLTLGAVLALALGGGGGAQSTSSIRVSTPTSVPGYVTAPFSAEQKLVQEGAHLVVADGCAACHLDAAKAGLAPDFDSFAGHRVRLRDGRSLLVDERYMRAGLLHPRANAIAGYDPAPMLAALARLHLASHPAQVAALAAFIEQVGPEAEAETEAEAEVEAKRR